MPNTTIFVFPIKCLDFVTTLVNHILLLDCNDPRLTRHTQKTSQCHNQNPFESLYNARTPSNNVKFVHHISLHNLGYYIADQKRNTANPFTKSLSKKKTIFFVGKTSPPHLVISQASFALLNFINRAAVTCIYLKYCLCNVAKAIVACEQGKSN